MSLPSVTSTASRVVFAASLCLCACLPLASQAPVNFESPQSHPIAISGDGERLYTVNTPGHALAVWSLADVRDPVLVREIPVGIEPIAVALESATRAWVVNHASDSISVIDLARGLVVDTIRVGDEPGDIVFAGTPRRAFVTSMTEREVQVFDAAKRSLVGTIPIFGDDPRSLLASRDGKTVWVAVTRSGNGTTIVPHTIAPLPPRPTNPRLPAAPKQGILVLAKDPMWEQRLGVDLPDNDIVEIDVATSSVRRNLRGIGTTLFNLAERPGADELWALNTQALNLIRFEPALRGRFLRTRVTVVSGRNPSTIVPHDLNPGIDYSTLPNPAALRTALSQVTDIVFAPDGKTAFACAFGTDRIAVLDAAAKSVVARIEVGNGAGTTREPRRKRGPRALVLHAQSNTLYCLNRLSNSLTVVDTSARRVVRELALFDPTPRSIREGRGFLYDAKLSGNGTVSCASCHIDGRTDGLAWDLGDPGGEMFNNGSAVLLHPMKGPLLTQTMQGFLGERIFHWRADRPGLASFNRTFVDLLGGPALDSADLATFVAYMRDIRFMPNPRRKRDDSLETTPPGESAKDGERIFLTKDNVGRDGASSFSCVGCHSNASGSGSFGFDGLLEQPMKAVHLRGLYKRMGRKKSGNLRTSGFGIGADGSSDDIVAHISNTRRFNPLTDQEKRALERYMLAFPTAMRPAVGVARTLDRDNIARADAVADLAFLIAQAEAGNCDLIGKGTIDGRPGGLYYDTAAKRFVRDRSADAALTRAEVVTRIASGDTVTFRGVPPGSGRRLGIDRDADSVLDGEDGKSIYGAASPACASPLALSANGEASIGSTRFALVVSRVAARAGAVLLVAADRGNLRVADLDVLVDLRSTIALPVASDARGEVVARIALPSDASLVGRRARIQAVGVASCGQLGLTASHGLELVFTR